LVAISDLGLRSLKGVRVEVTEPRIQVS
jgi:hypothetical protein